MKHRLLLIIAAAFLAVGSIFASRRYAGGDISLLPAYEEAGAVYLDYDGKPVDGSALDFFAGQGWDIMRVRLFVDPAAYDGPDKDPNACQSLDYILPICKRIKAAGLPLMLDFHYSDTWADPAKQWTPASWTGLDDTQLCQEIYDYTRETLQTLADEGVVPDFIQTGNEISYGMLWGAWNAPTSSLKKCFINSDANWERFTSLLKQAGKACREVCPAAKIVLHTERVDNIPVQDNFYTRMKDVDYDIIGLSYYPYFHGPLANLDNAVKSLETKFPDKEVMVVEAGYPYKWEVPGTTYDYSKVYPYSDAGQMDFTTALVDMLKTHDSVTGLIWWWPEYNAYRTSLSGWYNAPLFDSTTGRACNAVKSLAAFADNSGAGIDGVSADSAQGNADGPWHNLLGQPVSEPLAPGIYIRDGEKLIVR